MNKQTFYYYPKTRRRIVIIMFVFILLHSLVMIPAMFNNIETLSIFTCSYLLFFYLLGKPLLTKIIIDNQSITYISIFHTYRFLWTEIKTFDKYHFSELSGLSDFLLIPKLHETSDYWNSNYFLFISTKAKFAPWVLSFRNKDYIYFPYQKELARIIQENLTKQTAENGLITIQNVR